MKLHNKKTGELGELYYYSDKSYHFAVETKDPSQTCIYNTLGELLKDWTDFIVREPLIKDEKIRKAVRAWAEANNVTQIIVFNIVNGYCLEYDELEFAENGGSVKIRFKTNENLDTDNIYTISELCGEEE